MTKRTFTNQNGAALITFAILIMVLLGFTALAVEAGRWYLIKAELSKGVDAAALAGASSGFHGNNLRDLVTDVGDSNFGPSGKYATVGGSLSFTPVDDPSNKKVTVTGAVTARSILAQLFGLSTVPVSSVGAAALYDVEIMLVLDNSDSMATIDSGQSTTRLADLQSAAHAFVNFFDDTGPDKMGLITFDTAARVNVSLSPGFVHNMNAGIDLMGSSVTGGTNAEYALEHASTSLPDPGGSPVKQFVVFFTDGNPDAFIGKFTHDGFGTDKSAAIWAMGTDGSCDGEIDTHLYKPDTGEDLGVVPVPVALPGHECSSASTTIWNVFNSYPLLVTPADPCNVPWQISPPAPSRSLLTQTPPCYPTDDGNTACQPWFKATARNMAYIQADALKGRTHPVQIYVIRLGVGPDDPRFADAHAFTARIATGPKYEFYLPATVPDRAAQLENIFKRIAREIRLKLVR